MQLFREQQNLPTATGQSFKVSGSVVHGWLPPERDGDREKARHRDTERGTKTGTGTRTRREEEREREIGNGCCLIY